MKDEKDKNARVQIALLIAAALISFAFIIFLQGCALIRSTNSPHVVEQKTRHERVESFSPDTAIIMLSDIQCRDIDECASIDHAFDTIDAMRASAPHGRVVTLVAGDMTQSGEDWQIADYRQKEARIQTDEVYRVCGNHDVKSGLAQCKKLLGGDGLHYKKEIGNITLIGLSNWHEDAVQNNDLQKYIPDEGIAFLEREGKQALADGRILFILAHEKPEGVAWIADPRSFFFWKKHNPSNVYNSDALKETLSELVALARKKDGVVIVYIYGHTHTPPQWPGTVIAHDDILYINTSAMRTTSHIRDTRKFLPSSIFRKIFGGKKKKGDKSGKLDLAIAGVLKALFPWNKYSTARILFLKDGSRKAYLFTRNLTKDEWYDFAYEIQLSVPFECAQE